jgi:hypothetical protein
VIDRKWLARGSVVERTTDINALPCHLVELPSELGGLLVVPAGVLDDPIRQMS